MGDMGRGSIWFDPFVTRLQLVEVLLESLVFNGRPFVNHPVSRHCLFGF